MKFESEMSVINAMICYCLFVVVNAVVTIWDNRLENVMQSYDPLTSCNQNELRRTVKLNSAWFIFEFDELEVTRFTFNVQEYITKNP